MSTSSTFNLGLVNNRLGVLSGQIANLGATVWEIVIEDNQFVMYWHGVSAESPITISLEGADYVAYIAS